MNLARVRQSTGFCPKPQNTAGPSLKEFCTSSGVCWFFGGLVRRGYELIPLKHQAYFIKDHCFVIVSVDD